MIRVHIICEGQTEAIFVQELLMSHFSCRKIFLKAILIGNTGGNVTFDRLRQDVEKLLLSDRSSYCTTFFDFYGLPTDFPGKSESAAKVDLSAGSGQYRGHSPRIITRHKTFYLPQRAQRTERKAIRKRCRGVLPLRDLENRITILFTTACLPKPR